MQGGCRRSFRRRVAFLSSFPGPDSRWKKGFYTLGKKPPKNTRRSGRASTEMAPGTADIQALGLKSRRLTCKLLLTLTGFHLRVIHASGPPYLEWVSTRAFSMAGPLGGAERTRSARGQKWGDSEEPVAEPHSSPGTVLPALLTFWENLAQWQGKDKASARVDSLETERVLSFPLDFLPEPEIWYSHYKTKLGLSPTICRVAVVYFLPTILHCQQL